MEQSPSNSKRAARLAAVAVTGLFVTAVTATGSGADSLAATSFSNGQGSASAQSIKVNPTASALSIGITFGISLAGFQNTGAKADSRGIDLGIIGTTLAGAGCDGSPPSYSADKQPTPLTASSQNPDNQPQGYTDTERINGQKGDPNAVEIPAFVKNARASVLPYAEATTVSAPVGGPGLFEIDGARSNAVAQVVNAKTREAKATSDIASIDIAGVVKLTGLHWEAAHHTGADISKTGGFSVGGFSVAGNVIPLSADPSKAFDTINTVLKELGLEMQAPVVHEFADRVVVDPLAIAVIANPTRDSLAGTLFGYLQPAREQLTNALLNPPVGSCKNGTYITVADIAVGSVTGSGSFSIELGGVQVGTSDIKFSHSLLDLPVLGSLGNDNLGGGGNIDLGSGALPTDVLGNNIAPSLGGAVGTTGTPKPSISKNLQRAASTKGERGGKLAGLAAGTLALLAAVAEGDRRKMRKAQRMIPVDA